MAEEHGLAYQGQRRDGRHVWRIRPYVGTPPRRVSATFDTPTPSIKAARRKRAEVVDELERLARRADDYRTTVAQLLDDWIARSSSERSPRTMVGYCARADIIREHLGDLSADVVKLDDISAMYHQLRTGGTSEASLLEVHRVLQASFTWAYDMERISTVPRFKAVKPRHRQPKVAPPTPEVMRQLMVSLPDAEWARAVALLVLCGMRRGEVVGLRWADVTARTVWVRHSVVEIPRQPVRVQPYPKSKEHRPINPPAAAFAVLELQRTYVEAAAGGRLPEWVFPDWASARLSLPRRPGSISLAWGRYRKRKEFTGAAVSVRLHDLRHFYATTALASGRPLHNVARELGHTDVATTLRIYGHATEDGAAVGESVAGALGMAADPGEDDAA